MERKAQRGRKRERKTGVSREKQLQRLKPAEDERKLQTKRFVKLRVWKPKGGHHRFMIAEIKSKAVSTEKSGLSCLIWNLFHRIKAVNDCSRLFQCVDYL